MTGVRAYWKALSDGRPEVEAAEFALYSDAHVAGQIEELGPFSIFNSIDVGASFAGDLGMVATLRVSDFLGETPKPDLNQPSAEDWHGGDIADEVAALFSLALGIRLVSGGQTRTFEPDGDPRGSPREMFHQRPVLDQPGGALMIPSATGLHVLNSAVPLLEQYATLGEDDGRALLRAARAYQRGIWVAEGDPDLAWLQFVSSIEVASDRWTSERTAPLDALAAWHPDLAEYLHGNQALMESVAAKVVNYTGATKKFVSFIIEHAPQPPVRRPPGPFRMNWGELEKHVKTIYGLRSQRLHGAKPFPGPLLVLPFGEFDGTLAETVPGSTGVGASSWRVSDVPMYLHIFEYVVRNALITWWRGLPSAL